MACASSPLAVLERAAGGIDTDCRQRDSIRYTVLKSLQLPCRRESEARPALLLWALRYSYASIGRARASWEGLARRAAVE